MLTMHMKRTLSFVPLSFTAHKCDFPSLSQHCEQQQNGAQSFLEDGCVAARPQGYLIVENPAGGLKLEIGPKGKACIEALSGLNGCVRR